VNLRLFSSLEPPILSLSAAWGLRVTALGVTNASDQPLRETKKSAERSTSELISSAPNALDSIDRQISATCSVTVVALRAIANEVGLSEAGVRRRVQRLKDSGSCRSSRLPIRCNRLWREALIGIRVHGDVRLVADKIASIDEANYVVMTAGSFDIIAEVIAVDDDALVHLLNDSIRSIPV